MKNPARGLAADRAGFFRVARDLGIRVRLVLLLLVRLRCVVLRGVLLRLPALGGGVPGGGGACVVVAAGAGGCAWSAGGACSRRASPGRKSRPRYRSSSCPGGSARPCDLWPRGGSWRNTTKSFPFTLPPRGVATSSD